ncbi:hypothetical protein ACO0LM_12050 [Undibacterium sp. Di26W]|uniref:hypothetical protein n=1 Tax=Undibacterium sp. Di26W TaxID=3413035 RepID=UPI003BF3C69A
MKPVDQEFVHDPDNGVRGDCQRAVIASLMELPISEVPHFIEVANGDPSTYWDLLQAFCLSKGFVYLETKTTGNVWTGESDVDIYHEISGPSPRFSDVYHAVVGKNGQIVFDPHPSRAGLGGDPSNWVFAYLVKA